MKTDFSRLLYDKYFTLYNRNLEITRKDGKVVRGILAGVYKKGIVESVPYIEDWHIVDELESLKRSAESWENGVIVNTRDIATVRFCEDGSILNFEK